MVYRIRKSNSKETVIHQSRMRPYLERIPDDDASTIPVHSEDPDGADPDDLSENDLSESDVDDDLDSPNALRLPSCTTQQIQQSWTILKCYCVSIQE
jgi:hypothetical protein